jgi:hypothetical protein
MILGLFARARFKLRQRLGRKGEGKVKRIEWPGVATAVGLILIVAIISDLSKWQPLLAALVALAGGGFAYSGAMAKIYADQDKDRRDFERRRLGIYLRTEHICDLLDSRAGVLVEKRRARGMGSRVVGIDDLKITRLPDFDEAWANLELFPPRIAITISRIQGSIRTLDTFIEHLPPDTKWEINATIPHHAHMKVTSSVADSISAACKDVVSKIRPLINEMARNDKWIE